MEKDREFLEYIVKSLVNHPEDVQIERTVDDRGVLLRLKVHPDDMKIVIGRKGSTVRGIKTILRMIGFKNKQRVSLSVVEPEGSSRSENKASEGQQGTSNDNTVNFDDLSNLKI